MFVLFLDIDHVDVGGSHNIRKPLVDALNRVIGQDDLVAVMTPDMSARGHHLRPKDHDHRRHAHAVLDWGERDRMIPTDPEDEAVQVLLSEADADRCADQNGIADEMIERRREKRALDALQDLVTFLRGVREERKAILAITDGWLLFGPNPTLARPLNCQDPVRARGGIDPRTGRPTTKDRANGGKPPNTKCETRSVATLAQIDDEQHFRDLLDEANRANASFYPIDPRGLAVFDKPIMRSRRARASAADDAACGRSRDARRAARLAAHARRTTDGLAIVDANDLAARLEARRRRSQLVLPARLLLERQARWEVPLDHGPREAARRAGARAARVPGGDTGGRDAAAAAAAARAAAPPKRAAAAAETPRSKRRSRRWRDSRASAAAPAGRGRLEPGDLTAARAAGSG